MKITVLLFLLIGSIFAQTKSGKFEILVNTTDVSRTNKVDNNIWAIANSSLIKKDLTDGQIEVFNILNSRITGRVSRIFSDRSNRVWAGTDQKLFRLDSDGTVQTFESITAIHGIAEDTNGSIWVCSGSKLAEYDGTNWIIHNYSEWGSGPTETFINDLTIDQYNNKWVSAQSGLYMWDGSNKYFWNKRNCIFNSPNINRVFVDKYNNKWISTNNGLYKYDGQNFEYPDYWQNLPSSVILCSAVADNNDLLVGTFGGLALKDSADNWQIFTESNSIVGNHIQNIEIIGDDDYLISTNKGLFQLKKKKLTKIGIKSSSLDFIDPQHLLKDSKGNLWISAQHLDAGYLYKVNSFDLSSKWERIKCPSISIGKVSIDQFDNIWFQGDETDFYKYDGSVFMKLELPIFGGQVISMGFDAAGNLWICGSLGTLMEISQEGNILFEDTNGDDGYHCMIIRNGGPGQPGGDIIIGCFSGIIFSYNGNESNIIYRASSYINDMILLNNEIWFTPNYSGIYKMNLQDSAIKRYSPENSPFSLNLNRFYSLDNTNGGKDLYIVTKDHRNAVACELYFYENEIFTNITSYDETGNLSEHYIFVKDMIADNEGNNIILTDKGIIVFNKNGIINSTEKYHPNDIRNSYSLGQNYPNPFNSTTIISFTIPGETHVVLKIFDVLGREVASLINQIKPPGDYKIAFDGINLTSGIYFYRLQTDNYLETKKLLLLK